MTCPKCGHEQGEGKECLRCGVVFHKIHDPQPGRRAGAGAGTGARDDYRFGTSRKRRAAAAAFFSAILLLIASGAARDRLPPVDQLLPELQQAPVQQPVAREAFETTVGEHTYSVIPHHRYELWGIVVSHHDANKWWDIYHHPLWKDYINVKDLCVLWGDNLDAGVFRAVEFSSDPWTCYATTWDPDAWARFRPDSLANNHLLADRKDLSRRVMAAREGDQVYFRGYLADYKHSDWPSYRASSVTRSDTGNGACETVYLEDFRILRRANPLWRFLFTFGWVGLVAGLIGWFLFD